MKKRFILDTSVLLHDPDAIFNFSDNEVILPIIVLEEIDQFKKDVSEKGQSARHVIRYLDDLRSHGTLSKGVKLANGGTFMIDLSIQEMRELPVEVSWGRKAQNIILAVALRHRRESKSRPVILVTKDSNLRVKGDALGLTVEDYKFEKFNVDDLFGGTREVSATVQQMETLFEKRSLQIKGVEFYPNEFMVLKDSGNPSHSALVRYNGQTESLVPLQGIKDGIWGILPRNVEQSFAMDLLLNDSIKLVSLVGKAGTGKTLLALACGLAKTVDQGLYKRLLVSRPIFPMGKDIGYLPGDVEQKLNPWMQPIFDNLEFLLGGSRTDKARFVHRGYQELVNRGMLNIEPLTYIRGRSIPHQYLIVDEAQNLTPHEIKTIITRAGEQTKVVLTGDIYQIDNPYIDMSTNGLTYVIARFRSQNIAGHVSLIKGERSDLADVATKIL